MTSSSSYSTKGALTLSNSIIGVSILAMPYCMKACGIVLGILLLIGSALLTRFTCHLLLKSAVMSRRKTFEFIAFQTFGSSGKLLAELNIIGFMLGLLISFFVVFGDLGTAIISEILNLEKSETLRTFTLVVLGFGIALPLAMLKEIDIISKISTLSVIFYVILALKIILEAMPVLLTGYWKTKVTLWEPSGVLQCLPIFALALSCQTQIFTISDSLPDPSMKTMNSIVKIAVYICTGLYMIVGLFGYIGGCEKDISGNILISFSPGIITELIKLCFVLSVALSFPLVVIPCRTSIYSLLFKKSTGPFDVGASLMPELRFRVITFIIVFSTFIVGFFCPNIEIVLGFVGSTIGVLICIIFPAMMFIRLTSKNTFERRGAQVVLFVGIVLLVTCTWMHLQTVSPYTPLEESIQLNKERPSDLIVDNDLSKEAIIKNLMSTPFPVVNANVKKKDKMTGTKIPDNLRKSSDAPGVKRQEPPVPESPDAKLEGEINSEAIQKENKEIENGNKETEVLQKLENEEKKAVLEQVEIIKKLEAHQEVEKKLLEERRQLLAEIMNHKKAHGNTVEVDHGKIEENRGAAGGNVDVQKDDESFTNSKKLVEIAKDDTKQELSKDKIPEEKVSHKNQLNVKDKEVNDSGSQRVSSVNSNEILKVSAAEANLENKSKLPRDIKAEPLDHLIDNVIVSNDKKDLKNETINIPLAVVNTSKEGVISKTAIDSHTPKYVIDSNALFLEVTGKSGVALGHVVLEASNESSTIVKNLKSSTKINLPQRADESLLR